MYREPLVRTRFMKIFPPQRYRWPGAGARRSSQGSAARVSFPRPRAAVRASASPAALPLPARPRGEHSAAGELTLLTAEFCPSAATAALGNLQPLRNHFRKGFTAVAVVDELLFLSRAVRTPLLQVPPPALGRGPSVLWNLRYFTVSAQQGITEKVHL